MYRLPAPSTASPIGARTAAAVACPPSPDSPTIPLPATVLIAPVPAITSRLTERLSGKGCIGEHEAWLKGRFTSDEVKKLVEMLARIHD